MLKKTISAILVAAATAACSDSGGSGKLTVQMTDAPFPYSDVAAVNIFVVRIDARTQTATDVEATDATTKSGWTTIATPNRVINLMSLQGGVTTNLGTTELSTGTYNGF